MFSHKMQSSGVGDNNALCMCLCAEHFTCVVKVLYSLQYTQALAALSIRFSREERLAWSNTGAAKKVPPMTHLSKPILRLTSGSYSKHVSYNSSALWKSVINWFRIATLMSIQLMFVHGLCVFVLFIIQRLNVPLPDRYQSCNYPFYND